MQAKSVSWGAMTSAWQLILPLFLFASVAQAQIPGRWEKLDSQPSGRKIDVKVKTGYSVEGAFKASNPDSITMTIVTGDELRIAKADIVEIRSSEPDRDSLKNGALIGLGIGMVVGALNAGMADLKSTGAKAAAFAGASAAYSGIGALIDRAVRRREVLYRAR